MPNVLSEAKSRTKLSVPNVIYRSRISCFSLYDVRYISHNALPIFCSLQLPNALWHQILMLYSALPNVPFSTKCSAKWSLFNSMLPFQPNILLIVPFST